MHWNPVSQTRYDGTFLIKKESCLKFIFWFEIGLGFSTQIIKIKCDKATTATKSNSEGYLQ